MPRTKGRGWQTKKPKDSLSIYLADNGRMELARLQARCAFRELIARVRDFTVDEAAIRIRPGLIVRGLQNLPVQFTWH